MKNILVLIHDDVGQDARLQAALDITRAVGGHLTCLDVVIIQPVADDGFGYATAPILVEQEMKQESANKTRIKQRLAAEDVPWDWVDGMGSFEKCIRDAAALSDLIVVNRQLDKFPAPDMRSLAGSLVVRSGRPVLAVPDAIDRFDVTRAALVAWDGSAPAIAALQAAVPLLRFASATTILRIEDGSSATDAEEAAAYLSRHDIHPIVVRREADSAAEAILAEANSAKFGYLVMGGFSHARLTEALLGGVTRRLLTESRIPLFLAH